MTSTFEHRDSDTTELNELSPGKFLGRYEIARVIGRGGMGCVYEAVHRDLGKRVAIKTLLPSLAANPEARGRFLREGQAASRIRHPHVVDVTDVVADGPTSYLVMEYLEGEDLASLIERQGALALGEVADVLLPVIAAIAAAHELGVIHRDLKPENIFLARTSFGGPCPKVVDFGISKVLGDPTGMALTATSAVFGTMFYLPPEQLGGSREAGARGDQYALGAILYECVTGHRAFEGTNIYGVLKNVAEGVYPPARSWRPELPPRLEAAIDRAMRLNPAARFSSVRALAAELLPHASAPVRAVWTPVFEGAGEPMPEPAQSEPGAANLRPGRPPAATTDRMGTGTMLLPVSGGRDGERSPTIDLGESVEPALPSDDLRPPRSWMPRIAIIGVAVVIVVAAVVSGVRRTAPPVEPAEPQSVPSPVLPPRVVPAPPARAVPAPPARAVPAPPARAVPAPPARVVPRAPESSTPRAIPPTVESPATRRPRRDSSAARGAVARRRKPRTAPAPTNPVRELRTNVPIPD